jgi:hypothetical protein
MKTHRPDPAYLLMQLCQDRWGATVGTWKALTVLRPGLAKRCYDNMDAVQRRAADDAKPYPRERS